MRKCKEVGKDLQARCPSIKGGAQYISIAKRVQIFPLVALGVQAEISVLSSSYPVTLPACQEAYPLCQNFQRKSAGRFCGQEYPFTVHQQGRGHRLGAWKPPRKKSQRLILFFFLSDFPALIRGGVLLVAAEATCSHRNQVQGWVRLLLCSRKCIIYTQ